MPIKRKRYVKEGIQKSKKVVGKITSQRKSFKIYDEKKEREKVKKKVYKKDPKNFIR